MFTLAEWILRLTRGYFKATGKQPDGLAKIKIQMEAAQRVKEQNKIVPFRYKKSFKQELDEMKPTTVEDFIKKGDWDPSGMASGGIAGQLHLNQGGEAMPEHLTKVETNILKDKGFWIHHHGENLDARIGGMEAVKRGGRKQDPENAKYIFEQYNEFIKYGGDPTNYINDKGDSINFKERIENLKAPIPETRSADRGLSNILRV